MARSRTQCAWALAGLLLALVLVGPAESARRRVTMTPLWILDLDVPDLHDAKRRAKALEWLTTAPVAAGHRKLLKASELSSTVPNTYNKAVAVREGIVLLLADAEARGIRGEVESLTFVGLKAHALSFDHPSLGYLEPSGWRWEWAATLPVAQCAAHRSAWNLSGYTWSPMPTVARAFEEHECVASWMRARRNLKVAQPYKIVPDLRNPAYREWIADRMIAVTRAVGLRRVNLPIKSAWLHSDAPPRNTPESPRNADPWLPGPFPDDTYRDANAALAILLAEKLGDGGLVSVMNTGSPRPSEWTEHFPEDHYVRRQDAGLLDTDAAHRIYGYKWTILSVDALD